MKFKYDYHNKILTILESLNAEVLQKSFAYFGGGTVITLDNEEYRWSKDIDFICSISSSGYRYLRTIIFEAGYSALFRDLNRIQLGRSTTDQYGIRMVINVEGMPIKTEIIAEARFELDLPRYPDWSPVACLSLNDCFTAKLLANSDRFMDDSVQSRDLIDLAVLRLQSPLPKAAIEKAEKAYEVMRPLKAAVQRFQDRTDYREKCFSGLRIDDSQIPKLIDGIDFLASDVSLNITQRTFKEQHDVFQNT
ncbi:nucleotidyl transferase AbiEii/AbiGii toxin family protein [Scytonema sp. NUACC26]|uniref:nucleotidyl transferase AbiEii/AbiGii toxin family protein n=1 Tax=Scytonema sp. NUACC26 TaxID=3140176 RepID=UPI0034DBE691